MCRDRAALASLCKVGHSRYHLQPGQRVERCSASSMAFHSLAGLGSVVRLLLMRAAGRWASGENACGRHTA